MRKYKTARTWREEHPGYRLMIFQKPNGERIEWKVYLDPVPEGKFAFLGGYE